MKGTQLSLLDYEAPRQFIPFPLAARAGKIRNTADKLDGCRTKRQRDAYWLRTIQTLGEGLRRLGLADSEIEGQLLAFRNAVVGELNRRACQSSDHTQSGVPDDAA